MQRLARVQLDQQNSAAAELFCHYDEIVAVLNRHLPASTATMLARPEIRGEILEWYSDLQGQPYLLNDSAQHQNAKAQAEKLIAQRLNTIDNLRLELSQKNAVSAEQAQLLEKFVDALQHNTIQIYLVNNQPVITGWGLGKKPETITPPPPPPPPVVVKKKTGWCWLLPLLLLLLAGLAAYWFYFRPQWQTEPVVKNEQATTAAKEVQPEPPKQEVKPEPQPEPPKPEVKPEPQPEPPKQEAKPEPQPEPPKEKAKPEPKTKPPKKEVKVEPKATAPKEVVKTEPKPKAEPKIDNTIANRIKAAGGNPNGDLRVSIAWNNSEDLDLQSNTISAHLNKCRNAYAELDVDMNGLGCGSQKRDFKTPVENIVVTNKDRMPNGSYIFSVAWYGAHQASGGFMCQALSSTDNLQLQVKMNNKMRTYAFKKPIRNCTHPVKMVVINKIGGDFKITYENPDLRLISEVTLPN